MVVPVGRRFDILDKVQNKLGESFKGSPVFITTLYANETLAVRQNPPLVETGESSCFRAARIMQLRQYVCVALVGGGDVQLPAFAPLLRGERQEVRVSASALL